MVACLTATAFLGCGRAAHFENNNIGFYPPGTTYTDSWEYMASLYVETLEPGSMMTLQDKDVWIRVTDRVGNRVLDDRLNVRRCRILATCTWRELGRLTVDLSEEGVEYTGKDEKYNDPYSVELARGGPRHFMTLEYEFDPQAKRFVRVETRK